MSALAGAALGIGIAEAADLSGSAAFDAPITAPAYNWTGWYSGPGVGPGGKANIGDPLSGTEAAGNVGFLGGILGGFHGGYNLQKGNWVFGFETDAQGQNSTLGCDAARCAALAPGYSDRLPWFGTTRGRVGLTPASGWLFYATGGLAYGDLKTDAGSAFSAAGVGMMPYGLSDSGMGWTLGFGVEGVLPSDWTWKLEYLYLRPDDAGHNNQAAGFTFTANGHAYDNLVRAGLNYRFGWDGPVIGK